MRVDNECCNIDIVQGPNQRLSCLQACTMVRAASPRMTATPSAPTSSAIAPSTASPTITATTRLRRRARAQGFLRRQVPARALRVRRAMGHRRQLRKKGCKNGARDFASGSNS